MHIPAIEISQDGTGADDQTERNLKVQAQIIGGSPIPTFVINTEHVVTHWNLACQTVTGLASAEALGTPTAKTPARKTTAAPADLKPGMVLTRDLVSCEGVMLLAADYVLDDTLIRHIQSYAHVDGRHQTLHVRRPE